MFFPKKLLSLRADLKHPNRLRRADLLLKEITAMSEYRYYEFAAIDGPISDEGLLYARGCSSGADVSRVRWQNTYTFGDFHGSVNTLLKYYDAHFYIANWGTVRLGLAFPEGAIAPEAIQPYLRRSKRYEDTLTVKKIGNRCIVRWERNEEEGWGWTEGEGLIPGGARSHCARCRTEGYPTTHRAGRLGGITSSPRTQYIEPGWDDWRHAAALGRDLAAKGYNDHIPLTDPNRYEW
jgi:hypothetical protein